jgi:hypothetical protein
MPATPEQDRVIDRREAVKRVAAIMGGTALIGSSALLQACGRDRTAAQGGVGSFTPEDVAFLDEVAETIIPETNTPGAKATKTGAFMALMVTDTYDDRDQETFRSGMRQLNEASTRAHGSDFMASTPAQRLALLENLDREQKQHQESKQPDDPNHYFRLMKELTLLGYFTSEIGYTQAQRYMESPGRFDPCVPYTAGETSWAPHA